VDWLDIRNMGLDSERSLVYSLLKIMKHNKLSILAVPILLLMFVFAPTAFVSSTYAIDYATEKENEVLENEIKEDEVVEEEMEVENEENGVLDVYELFWPIAPGKTVNQSFYFLKQLKENIRAVLILDKIAKADYQMFLVTKRVVEADTLVKQGESDAAEKTLKLAQERLKQVLTTLEDAKSKNELKATGGTINIQNQAKNVKRLTDWYVSQDSEVSWGEVDNLVEKILQILS